MMQQENNGILSFYISLIISDAASVKLCSQQIHNLYMTLLYNMDKNPTLKLLKMKFQGKSELRG